MVSDIEFLEAICERMQQVGLVQSKADFSIRMLGKGPSYLTSMSARDRKVPNEVMSYLAGQLQDGVADDDAELARLGEEAKRRQHARKHRADMLECIAGHRATELVGERPPQQTFVARLTFRQRFIGWLFGRVVAP